MACAAYYSFSVLTSNIFRNTGRGKKKNAVEEERGFSASTSSANRATSARMRGGEDREKGMRCDRSSVHVG